MAKVRACRYCCVVAELAPAPLQINASLVCDGDGADAAFTETNTIGVLDIFGFEIMQSNNLEQLLINYANERLHGLFIEGTFLSTSHASWIALTRAHQPASRLSRLCTRQRGFRGHLCSTRCAVIPHDGDAVTQHAVQRRGDSSAEQRCAPVARRRHAAHR